MNSKYLRKENEDNLDYAMRIIEIKKEERPDDLDWDDIVKLLGEDLNKDSLRKSQDTNYGGIAVYNAMKRRNNVNLDYNKEIEIQLQELKKERMKIADERSSLNRRLRSEARKEDFYNLAINCAKEINTEEFKLELNFDKNNCDENKTAVLTLSDFHYGLEINEFNNKYNPDIFKKRFSLLLEKTIEKIKFHNVKTIYVLGLGDYLSGIIHNTIRIDNRENIVKQVIRISEYLYVFLTALSNICEVYYYDVCDNHSRVFADKNENSNSDNFSLFIKWYLEEKVKENINIHIMSDTINHEIGTIEIYGRNYAFTHGHRDKVSEIVQNLSLMTKKFYDAIFIGHSHHFEANEIHKTYVYVNGTLSGGDEYSNNLRKTSNPSQNLFILSKNDGIECQYTIKLDK